MVKKINVFDFLLVVIGFIYGNLFVINFSSLQWNLILIFFIVFIVEFLNKLLYFRIDKTRKASRNSTQILRNKEPNFVFLLPNTLKRGFLLGLFLEAFKVGS